LTDQKNLNITDYLNNHSGVIYFLLTKSTDTEAFWATDKQVLVELVENFSITGQKNNVSCNTKEPIKCKKKTRTQGLLISAFNCGIICGFREMFGSESKKQIALFLMDVNNHFEIISKNTIYDDACHLKKYVKK
jgi:hypothetical protein